MVNYFYEVFITTTDWATIYRRNESRMDINLSDHKLVLDCRTVKHNRINYVYIYFTDVSETKILQSKELFNILGAEW